MNYQISPDVIASFQFGSGNRKTGQSIQVYMLPHEMIENGGYHKDLDERVCFYCRYSKNGGCYVLKGFPRHGLNAKLKRLKRTQEYKKPNSSSEILAKAREYTYIRFGAYGEPVLLPVQLIKDLTKGRRWTGYTHQWKLPENSPYKDFFMASVHSMEEAMQAESMGWRWYLILEKGQSLPKEFEIRGNAITYQDRIIAVNCPASKESGERTTCNRCGLCNGASKSKNIWIYKH